MPHDARDISLFLSSISMFIYISWSCSNISFLSQKPKVYFKFRSVYNTSIWACGLMSPDWCVIVDFLCASAQCYLQDLGQNPRSLVPRLPDRHQEDFHGVQVLWVHSLSPQWRHGSDRLRRVRKVCFADPSKDFDRRNQRLLQADWLQSNAWLVGGFNMLMFQVEIWLW